MTDTDRTDEVRAIKDAIGGRIFGAGFTKRDGTFRTGSFRFSVKKHLKGGDRSYDTDARGHLVVFDMKKEQYRTIRIDAIDYITVGGRIVHFSEGDE